MKLTKLVINIFGNHWAIGIESSSHNNIILTHNSLFNFSGTDSKNIKWLNESFGYVWSTEKMFKKYLFNSSFAFICENFPDLKEKEQKKMARNLAAKRESSVVFEPFLTSSSVKANYEEYAVSAK